VSLLCFPCASGNSQQITGFIRGTIFDPSGAIATLITARSGNFSAMMPSTPKAFSPLRLNR
jgi:hypothetical protein